MSNNNRKRYVHPFSLAAAHVATEVGGFLPDEHVHVYVRGGYHYAPQGYYVEPCPDDGCALRLCVRAGDWVLDHERLIGAR